MYLDTLKIDDSFKVVQIYVGTKSLVTDIFRIKTENNLLILSKILLEHMVHQQNSLGIMFRLRLGKRFKIS